MREPGAEGEERDRRVERHAREQRIAAAAVEVADAEHVAGRRRQREGRGQERLHSENTHARRVFTRSERSERRSGRSRARCSARGPAWERRNPRPANSTRSMPRSQAVCARTARPSARTPAARACPSRRERAGHSRTPSAQSGPRQDEGDSGGHHARQAVRDGDEGSRPDHQPSSATHPTANEQVAAMTTPRRALLGDHRLGVSHRVTRPEHSVGTARLPHAQFKRAHWPARTLSNPDGSGRSSARRYPARPDAARQRGSDRPREIERGDALADPGEGARELGLSSRSPRRQSLPGPTRRSAMEMPR